jgi:Na+/H+ antiporter NhaD/arsenite permease-like protein
MNRVELVVVKFLYGAIMFIEGLNDLGLNALLCRIVYPEHMHFV